MILPKTITLQITRAIMKRVPKRTHYDVLRARRYQVPRPPARTYGDPDNCVLCKAIRAKFPKVASVAVLPSDVSINGASFIYDPKFEPRLESAHRRPNRFAPFDITLTRV